MYDPVERVKERIYFEYNDEDIVLPKYSQTDLDISLPPNYEDLSGQ